MRFLLVVIFTIIHFTEGWTQSYVPERSNPFVRVSPAVAVEAYAFPLHDVRLLPGPFYKALQRDSAYVSQLVPDRLLYRFHTFAGLPAKDSIYGGWEQEGLSGHTLGHYLSALSLLYASTGSKAFQEKVNYVVDELARCQRARKTGYIGAIPNEDSIFNKVSRGQIQSSGFDLNGGWSPWYTVHKVMAGLCDAYLYGGNNQALQVVTNMADWVGATIGHLPDSLRLKMLYCEFGGMNDVLANIYSFTGNRKYLDMSFLFYDEFVMGRLAKGEDPLPGKHSNTNVPKAVGSARQFELTASAREQRIATAFWEHMTLHHSYVIGGNSNYEYCGAADSLNDRLSDNTCETCNTYNMLKLTRHLFAWSPSSVYMDYYERALYNHILASQHPQTGMLCYFVPLRMGTQKQYSDAFNTFTCCVGSGLENHAKYAESVFSEGKDGSLYVNLFIPSVLQWRSHSATVTMSTDFPERDRVTLHINQPAEKVLNILIRKPFWLKDSMQFFIHGRPVTARATGTGYLRIEHVFHRADSLQWIVPMGIYAEAMPDNNDRIAFKYGPLVLAGVLGESRPDPVEGVPVLLSMDREPSHWVEQTKGALVFRWKNVGKPFDAELVPFYTVADQFYSVYFDYFSAAAWNQRQQAYEKERSRQALLEERTIDHFRIGEMQPERDHLLQASERSYVDDALGRKGREARAGHYFTFRMRIDPVHPNHLVCTYIGDDHNREFDIVVADQYRIKVEWNGGKTGTFYDMTYPLPNAITRGIDHLDVRIEANYGKTAGRIFGVRTIRD